MKDKQIGFSIFSSPALVALATLAAAYLSSRVSYGVTIASSLAAEVQLVADGNSPPTVIDTTGDPVFATDTYTNGGVTSSGTAQATYGILKAEAEITKSPAIEPFNFATSRAQFIDDLTVTGGVGGGTITFTFQLDGTLTDINAGESRATVEFNMFLPSGFQGHNDQFQVQTGSSRILNESIVAGPFSFDFGVPFTVNTELFARVSLEESDSGTATSDFFSTASLTSVDVGGATGPVTVIGASGTNYLIPEPSSLMLLATGLAVMPVRRRRRAS